MNLWESAAKLRIYRYESLRMEHPYVFKWKWYSYRRFKLKLYVWSSSFLAHFFIKLKVKPNYITAVYAVMGIIGGILLAIPHRVGIYIAISFFYFRGILDWTDGIVARINKQTSISGMVFDSYGAHLGWVFLWMGLGIYLGHSTSRIFYFLSPLIPTLFAADLYSSARDTLIGHHFIQKAKDQNNRENTGKDDAFVANIRRTKPFIDKIFEHNARTVDLIVFMVLFELITPYRILWIFYFAFLIWQVTVFTIRFFMITRGGWAEAELKKLTRTLCK